MTFEQFVKFVEPESPFPFDSALCSEDIPDILKNAITKAMSKFEKTESKQINGSTTLDRATTVSKVTPTYVGTASGPSGGTVWSVFNFMNLPDMQPVSKVEWYFTPERKLIIRGDRPCYIEYIVDPLLLKVEDLDSQYLDWAKKYALALLKVREGYEGSRGNITALPFDLNYKEMKSEGLTEKKDLETDLEDMYFGLFVGKS